MSDSSNMHIIWKSRETGTLFLETYIPLSGIPQKKVKKADFDRTVLNFKQYGTGSNQYRLIVEALKALTDSETSVGIPAHDTEPNSVQKICDQDIVFKPKYTRAKKHIEKIKEFEKIERERIELKIKKKGIKKVLLIDDVLSTGETIAVYTKLLKEAGVKTVIPFVIGHKKTRKSKAHVVIINEKKDDDHAQPPLKKGSGKSPMKKARVAGRYGCTATSKRTGKPCNGKAIKGKDVCRFHGGISGTLKHGLNSKYLIPSLKDKIDAAKQDNRHIDLEDKIATTCAIIQSFAEKLESGEFIVYKGKDAIPVTICLDDMAPKMVELMESLSRQIERYHKIKHGTKHTVSFENLDVLLQQIIKIINDEIKDVNARKRIANRFDELHIPSA